MSSKARFNRNGRRTRKRFHRRKVPTNRQLNRKIKKLENNVELKWLDGYSPAITAPKTGQVVPLCSVTQGTAPINRIGDMINATSIKIRYSILSPSAILDPVRVRVVVFWDKTPAGVSPLLIGGSITGSVFDNTVTVQPVFAPINWNYVDRYRIIYDKVITLNPKVVLVTDASGNVTDYCSVMSTHKKKIKLGRHIKYDDNAPGIASYATNGLFMGILGDVAPGNEPTVEYSTRLYFKDS